MQGWNRLASRFSGAVSCCCSVAGTGYHIAFRFRGFGREHFMNLQNIFARSIGPVVVLLFATCESSTAQQRNSDNETYYVANTRPPDAFLALRTNPTTASGQRLLAMPNGTSLKVLERRGDGWW
jgi:hypothetical protein